MILLTHAYLVPREKEDQHARLVRRLAEVMSGLGAEFEVFEQRAAEIGSQESATGRFVQIARFRDQKHLQQVQAAETSNIQAQALIAEICELVDMAGQQMRGTYLPGTYVSLT